MDERNESDRVDEVMLPGFRFHPTDEELVGFYLKRKVQDKPLSVELIKQLDIYKYDPWDLPKLAVTGEKEWYFYCPRDRKYRNSMRPNRVTTGGFWKATGTDRPVYSSEGTKCLGLKKSLVFYKGRAARGTKTDWMMHEFRLLPLMDPSLPKRPFDHKTIPPNESWTICKVFKKTNSMAQRAQSQSWVSPLPEARSTDMFSVLHSAPTIQFGCSNDMKQRPNNGNNCKPWLLPIMEVPCNFMFSPAEMPANASEISMLRNLTPTIHGAMEKASTSIAFEQPQQYNGFTANACDATDDQWGAEQEANFPLNLVPNLSNEWKPSLPWDPAPSPSEMSTSYSTNECYT